MDDNEGDFPDDNSSGDQSIKMNSVYFDFTDCYIEFYEVISC